MRATYRLAKVQPFHLQPFGPCMTLAEAETYRRTLTDAGYPVVVVNTESM
jgi:hypothetical protein